MCCSMQPDSCCCSLLLVRADVGRGEGGGLSSGESVGTEKE